MEEPPVREIPCASGTCDVSVGGLAGSQEEDDRPSESRAADGLATEDRSTVESEDKASEGCRTANVPDAVVTGEKCDAAADTDATEESSESKERFRQRLWCFLFENLNRSVDELYLLCELECDMENIEEAILVLEESISDFKDLKSRVEGFNSGRKPVCHAAKDGMLANVKMEARRPHALSWEVRRMTTSSHKAEILSSSLEAFRRIQMERTHNHSTSFQEVLHSRCRIPQNDFMGHADNSSDAIGHDMCSRKSNNKSWDNTGVINEIHNAKCSNVNKFCEPLLDTSIPVISAGSLSEYNSVNEDVRSKHCLVRQSFENDCKASKDKKERGGSFVADQPNNISAVSEKEKVKEKDIKVTSTCKSMDAWKEKRNWEAILRSPSRCSSKGLSPAIGRKNIDRARTLHDKLMSPEKKKKTMLDMKKESEEKHARAMRIRNQLENEKMQRLQRTSEKMNRVNAWQAVRSLKLKEGMCVRHQRSESRHEAYLARVVKRAGDESSKVNEVRFITSLNEENKKLMLRQKLHDSEIRRAEKLQVMKTKQREDMAKEEAAFERRKLLEAEKLQRLAETQRKKEEAQLRREEDRKASSAAREARALEQLRRKEERAKSQQEEAELLAQKLAEKLRESEHRRKFYLEQIREKASMDFRDQSSPLLRRSLSKDGQVRLSTNGDCQTCSSTVEGSYLSLRNVSVNQSLKRRIKKIRQKLMALKYDFVEPPVVPENVGPGYRSFMGTTKMKIGRWLQDLQRLRQERKDGSASIGLIVSEITKFLEGKEAELHASRQAGLIDYIASALPASHNSRPGTCQVPAYFLRLLKVILTLPANRDYFLSQNLLPPIIPMLSTSLENYIKIAASLNQPGNNILLPIKVSSENLESVAEILENFLWIVTAIIGHAPFGEMHLPMWDGLIELVVSYQIIHRLHDLFALHDRLHIEGSPFPSVIIYSLDLLVVLTSRTRNLSTEEEDCLSQLASMTYDVEATSTKDAPSTKSDVSLGCESPSVKTSSREHDLHQDANDRLISGRNSLSNFTEDMKLVTPDDEGIDAERIMVIEGATGNGATGNSKEAEMKQPVALLIAAIAETGLVSLPSLLTAILLQANNKNSYVLPSNFDEVAIGVLKVLNSLAMLNITFLQNMLALADLKMEFFHLTSFLLSHCTSKWKVATDQVGQLLIECLSLLGHFALFHSENQAVLRWGKSPTILHKMCDLPFGFFSNPELMPILAGALVASFYGCEQNRGIMLQELSIDMLLSLLRSCHQNMLPAEPGLVSPEVSTSSDVIMNNKVPGEAKRFQGDVAKLSRRNGKFSYSKSLSSIHIRTYKSRNSKDSKGMKCWDFKNRIPGSGIPSFPLYARFSISFLDRVEGFLSGGIDATETIFSSEPTAIS